MKWYNKNRTQCLDLDKISYWQYDVNDVLRVYIDSASPLNFYGEDADNIYKLLTTDKKEIF